MIYSYITTSFRNLIKNKLYTFINIFGLTLGVTCALLIFLITRFELSFDNYHRDVERIYRIVEKENEFGNIKYSHSMPYVIYRYLAMDFDEIEYSALVDGSGDATVKIVSGAGPVLFQEGGATAFVNPDFLRIFQYTWIAGTPEEALKNQNSVVLSRSTAQKYFGDHEPIGQTIELSSIGITYNLTVTGLVEDVPGNTDLPFNLLVRYNGEGENKRGWESWSSSSGSIHCYIKLRQGVTREKFGQKIAGYLTKYRDDEEAKHIELQLQPLSDLHYDTRFYNFGEKVISKSSIFALGLIGLFLLITACINFINLNTVLVTKRAKEVGIRKVLGVKRSHLIWHLLAETGFITLLSILAALGLSELLIFKLNQIFGYNLTFSMFSDGYLFLFLLGTFLVVSLFSGLYPAMVLSGFKPLNALKSGQKVSYVKAINLRKGLVILQLAISQLLVICVIVVFSQMEYLQNAPMGLDKHAVQEFSVPDHNKISRLNQQLQGIPGISNFSYSNTGSASGNVWGGDFSYPSAKGIIKNHTEVKFVDTGFISTYGLKLIAGANIRVADSVNGFLVNESFVKAMGITDPGNAIGEVVTMWGRKEPISGVLQDFNTQSFHASIKPVIMMYGEEHCNLAALKLIGGSHLETLSKVEKTWKSIFPDHIFEGDFLETKLNRLYRQEKRVASLFQIATIIAIIIGCIGLFGLISFLTNQRSKEMGIRKALGASSGQIMLIFAKEFVLLILVAFLVAAPVSWHYMQQWLQNFAYGITIKPWIFIVGILITVGITLTTVGYKSILVAINNPVNSLRDE